MLFNLQTYFNDRKTARAWAALKADNPDMRRRVLDGRAVNLAGFPRTENGDYLLGQKWPDNEKDFCDLSTGEWIWSIGRDPATGQVLASTSRPLLSKPGL